MIELREQVDKELEKYRNIKIKISEEKNRLKNLNEDFSNIEQSQNIVQIVSQSIQQQAHNKLAVVVTTCLQEVFPDKNYEFKILFEKKRNKTEAKLILLNDKHIIEDPLNEDSGGVCDIAAFVLRLSCLMLNKPPLRKLVVLDEPFKNVSEEYLPNVSIMLEKLSKDFKIQFIVVTHLKSLMIGKVVRL